MVFDIKGKFNSKLISSIGKPLERKEDERLLRGEGLFSDDFNLEGQYYVTFVRSPYPHAKIKNIDKSDAEKSPGVIAIFTGEDCLADSLHPIPHSPVPSTKYDLKLTDPEGKDIFIGPQLLLPVDKVRHVGEAVVMVIAKTNFEAQDAAEKVYVDYDELDWTADIKSSLKEGSPKVWDEIKDNICVDTIFGNPEKVDKVFNSSKYLFSKEFHIGRVTGVPLEPRSALASYDSTSKRYLLYAGSNGAVRHKFQISKTLNIDPESLRIICHDVGGNFGTKNRVYIEFPLVLWASKKIDNPIKYTATRSESFLSDVQGRDLFTKVELSMDEDYKFTAFRASNVSNVGARVISLSPLGKGIALVTGPYDIPLASARARAVFTNTVPTNAYRSSGRPEVTFAMERLIEIAAKSLNIDPIKLRRINLINKDDMPYRNALGITYDSGEYEDNMNKALALSDLDNLSSRKEDASQRGKFLGFGFSNYVESSVGNPKESVELRVNADGFISLIVGTQPTGQGHETSFAQVAADLLGLAPEEIKVVFSDTDIVKKGGGSHSGRSMRHAGTVICLAAEDLIDRGKKLCSLLFDQNYQNISFASDGSFTWSDKKISWFELAEAIEGIELSGDLHTGLNIERENEMHEPVFPNGCAACEVEIDKETFVPKLTKYIAIDDVGRAINPLIVDGQTHGSIATGVGQALFETFYLDKASGQPLTGSLMDYGIPRADQLPSFVTELNEVLSPTNPLGIKSAGEGATTPALAAVINAVVNALEEFDIEHIDMPATSFNIWRSVNNKNKESKS